MSKNTEGNSQTRKRSMSNRTIVALLISVSMVSAAIITLSTVTSDSFAQGANNNSAATSSGGGQGTAAAGMSLNCQSIASTIGGIPVPNPNKVCDVLIPRQAPTIIGPGNMNMNKFSTINSIVEVAAVSDLMIKSAGGNTTAVGRGGGTSAPSAAAASNNTNSQRVFVMGEFSLLDPQLVTMIKTVAGYNWTIAAVHNHMVLEKPKMMFVHWSAEGNLNTITNQIKNVLLMLSRVPSNSTS